MMPLQGENSMNPILSLAREIHEEMIGLRRDFHMHPEIGFDVHRTAGIVAEKLNQYGLTVRTGVGKTGVIGDLIVPNSARTIALRADMDALPMEELNDVPYKSRTPMRAHMCGHDAHTSMLIGAAKILSAMKPKLHASVRFIFQPSEEALPGGAKPMVQEGALEGVDEIYALHVMPTIQTGCYGICMGYAMAQPDSFEITITGCGGHAALPHKAVDPVVIAAQIILSLQTIVARQINPLDAAVLTVTQVHAGNTFNVIPETCTLSGTVRTYEKETQAFIKQKIDDIVQGVAGMHGAKGVLNYVEGYPSTYNHKEQAIKAKDVGISLAGEKSVDFPAQKMMYGEDFGYFTQQIKGCYILLGCRNEAKGITEMVHNPRFDIDEECLVYGAAMHIGLAMTANA
jgi:amidohydrolase